MTFFKTEEVTLPSNQILEEHIDGLETEDRIELDDECYDLLITKMCDFGVHGNARETIIEMEEIESEEAEIPNRSSRPRRVSRAPAYHADMLSWD